MHIKADKSWLAKKKIEVWADKYENPQQYEMQPKYWSLVKCDVDFN